MHDCLQLFDTASVNSVAVGGLPGMAGLLSAIKASVNMKFMLFVQETISPSWKGSVIYGTDTTKPTPIQFLFVPPQLLTVGEQSVL